MLERVEVESVEAVVYNVSPELASEESVVFRNAVETKRVAVKRGMSSHYRK